MSGTAVAEQAAIPTATSGSDGDSGSAVGQWWRRSPSTWDVVGVLVVISGMLAANQAAVEWAGTPLGTSRGIRTLSIAVALFTALMLLFLIVRDRNRLGRVPRFVTDVWRDPPTDWVAFILGIALAIPTLSFYWPRQGPHSDSGRLLSSVAHVWRGDLGYLVEVQEPYLPHVLYGPAMAVGGLPGARLLAILSVMMLVGVTALITYRITGSMWGAGASAVALLCISETTTRANFMPLYPLMLTLGYLGGWYAYRAVTDADARWRYAVVAGICLALSPEAHALGQLFLGVPALVALLAPRRRLALIQTARTYAVVIAATLPRLVINLTEGWLDHVTTYRTDWWVTQGYVRYIQENLWRYEGINEPLDNYLRMLPERFYNSLGGRGWLVVAAVVLGWLCSRWRQRLFILAVLGFMVAAVTIQKVPSFPRYYSPLFPGMAILAGVLVATLVRQRQWMLRLGAVVCSISLVVGAMATIDTVHASAESVRRATEALPLQRLVDSIDDDRGVIGARAHQSIFGVTADIPTWGDQYLTEDEYVTYLTWPSDNEVIDLMERYHIGWVVVHPQLLYETRYNDVWLLPFHGRAARHVEALAASPRFCRWFEESGYLLYKLGPCTSPPEISPTGNAAG